VGSPGKFPSRGEYLPVDVSNLGIAGADPRHRGSGGRDAAQYPGAEAGAGATAGDGLPAVGFGSDGDVGKSFSALLRPRDWRPLRVAGDRSGVRVARWAVFADVAGAAVARGADVGAAILAGGHAGSQSRSPAGLAARGVVSPSLESTPAQQSGGPGVAH